MTAASITFSENGQLAVSLVIVTLALAALARRCWQWSRGSSSSACSGCDHAKSTAGTTLSDKIITDDEISLPPSSEQPRK